MNIKINLKENIILIYSILFISSALIGIFINYSPIPEADFWSIFDHIYALDQGNWKHIFNQHNEHRPAIIYLLTYLDYRFFGNSFYLNYLIIFISFIFSAFLFNKIFNNHHKKNSNINKYYFLLILCFVFFWSQKPNFIFPFHISIIWVNLFILTALYFYKKFHDENNKFYFLYSIIFSVLSIFTVVTGIFAFPLLVLYSFLIKKFKETIFFICLSCLSFYLYFNNFNFVSHHSNFWELNLDNFLKIYLYFFGYLGSIFSFMFGKGYFGLFIAIIFGHIFMYLTISYFYKF
jgi:hypothetical protein